MAEKKKKKGLTPPKSGFGMLGNAMRVKAEDPEARWARQLKEDETRKAKARGN